MIDIIPYSGDYKETVTALILNILEDELGFKGYDRPDLEDIPAAYQKDSDSNFWIAIDGGEVVGTMGLKKKNDTLAYIKRVTVKKEFRNQGLGKKLLQTAVDFAKAHGYKTIYAGTVSENQNAINFYKRHGFQVTDDIPDDITAADTSICLALTII